MARIKTDALKGAALDWAVSKCEGYDCLFDDEVSGAWLVPQQGYLHDEKPLSRFSPSTNWAQGGPIIERERIDVKWLAKQQEFYCAMHQHSSDGFTKGCGFGPTPLIAAMRCYVASRLGDELDVPAELCE